MNLKAPIQRLARSSGTRHGIVMAVATVIAGGFDYATQVIVARMLVAEISVFLAVTALLQVMVYATNVIRNVVAFYTAELTVRPDALVQIGAFLRRRWRWAWQWGLVATAVMALLSPLIARVLRIDTPAPLWAGSLALLLLFLRPVTDGTLQGIQHFGGLGSVQILQAVVRVILAPLLIFLGLRSFGAILSLPLASAAALLLALWLLRPYFQARDDTVDARRVSGRYSIHTLIGLAAFALLINLDAIVVRIFFPPAVANNYGPMVPLGKMNLFVPIGLGLVLFPKATQRQAAGRDPRPVLLLALAVTLLPGFLLTLLYFLFPGFIVQTIFGEAYADPGMLLGLVGLATTFFAGINMWLNYALSLEHRAYIYILAVTVGLQLAGMVIFNDSLVAMVTVMVTAGLVGNVAGALTTLRASVPLRP